MNLRINLLKFVIALLLFSALNPPITCFAQTTAFTYQGRLNEDASVATGTYDLRFALFNAGVGGTQVGNTLTNPATGMSNGLFAVTLDFGANFPGADRWLEIGVRSNGSTGAFTTLTPRQPITPAPYAINAAAATSATVAENVTGNIPDAQLSSNIARLNLTQTFIGDVTFNSAAGSFSGNGVGLTNVNAQLLDGLDSTSFSTNRGFLHVVFEGTGGGTMTSSSIGLNTSGSVLVPVTPGTLVALTAAPDVNSTFSGWSGPCTGTSTCNFTVGNGVTTVRAHFQRTTYVLSVSKTGAGTIVSDPPGLYCGTKCSIAVPAGTMVTLTAIADAGATFSGWSGTGCSGASPSCTFTMDAAKSISAFFTGSPTLQGEGSGVTNINAANISSGTLADARLSSNVALLNASPSFSGTITASSFSGSGANITSINAANISSGTVSPVRGGTGANLSSSGGSGQYVKQTTAGGALSVGTIPAGDLPNHSHSTVEIVSGTLPIARGGTAASSAGSAGTIAYSTGGAYAFSSVGTTGQILKSGGSAAPTWGAVNLASSTETTGTLLDSRLSGNVTLLSSNQTFTGSNNFNGAIRATNGNNFVVGSFAGDGSGLTNLNGGALEAGSISSSSLANGSITAAHLAPGAVSSLGAADGSPTTALSVDSAGLVGIGTTNPAAGLEITASTTILAPKRLFQVEDETSGYTNLSGALSVAVSSNLLAVSGYNDSGVTIVDITNPSSPIRRSQIRDGDGTFTNLGSTYGLAMKSNLLAVAAYSDATVTLVTLTNPAVPVKLAELRDGIGGWNELGGAYAVAISGNLMAIAAQVDNAVTLADISDPAAPVKRAELKDGFFGFTNLAGALEVALSGNLLVIGATSDNAVTLVDVSDPANPIKQAELRDNIGGYNYLNGVNSVSLSGGLLAIASFNEDAVTLVNVTNPASPVKLAEIRNGVGGITSLDAASAVELSGNQLAVGANFSDAVTLFDISDPANPRQIAVMRDNVGGFHYLNGVNGVAFAGTNLAIAAENALTLASFPTAAAGLVSQGWVGIGTDAPAAALHVVGDVVVQSGGVFDINSDRVELGIGTAAVGLHSTAMGFYTSASGNSSTAMGDSTTASGTSSTAMGFNTIASGTYSTAMGYDTTASGSYSTAMGYRTTASGTSSTAMGYDTTANGAASTAMGRNTTASGDYSAAMGYYVSATNTGSFVWGDTSTGAGLTSTNNNSVTMRAAGGYRLFSNSGASAGVSLAPSGTAWASLSDRAAKKNFQPLDGKEVLEKLAAMPIQHWNYHWESDNDVPHIGPVAQDFKRAFYSGRDDTSITTLEFDGVALAAIQGLNQKLEETRVELKRKDAENTALKERLEALEKIVLVKQQKVRR